MKVIRRLEGMTYWVIEDPNEIYDFLNPEVRQEWEEDVKFECRKPSEDPWLRNLSKRKWYLETMETDKTRLNPSIMNPVDGSQG